MVKHRDLLGVVVVNIELFVTTNAKISFFQHRQKNDCSLRENGRITAWMDILGPKALYFKQSSDTSKKCSGQQNANQ
jgi:hypothetical protein